MAHSAQPAAAHASIEDNLENNLLGAPAEKLMPTEELRAKLSAVSAAEKFEILREQRKIAVAWIDATTVAL